MQQTEIRRGAYYDSVILMQLQRGLAALNGVTGAGVVMGTPANKDVLAQGNLLTDEARAAQPDDLIIVVEGVDQGAAAAALAAVDDLLIRRRSEHAGDEYRPKSLEAAVKTRPDAGWVLVSVPGRYAAAVADEALSLGKHVFLYSDNVSLDDEVNLKTKAADAGLLVMGPDCGTAIVNGIGLGFANAVRRGNIGVVGASGTGLQHVTARIHQLGGGVSHALGTGGRDLAEAVGAVTARQALDLLSRDPETEVIVLISKPPAPAVAADLLRTARATGKPVIVNFIGYTADGAAMVNDEDNLTFVRTLDAAATAAVTLARAPETTTATRQAGPTYLRALYSGGTLAYEALLLLEEYLPAVYSNVPLDKRYQLERATQSREHTVVDLGEDELTVGRLHPMMDNELRIQRLHQEAAEPTVGLLLLDVVLGYGAHPNPAAELAPAIRSAIRKRADAGNPLHVVAVLVGTDEDPQRLEEQAASLREAGATLFTDHEEAVRSVGKQLQAANRPTTLPPVPLTAVTAPLVAVNAGLESFAASLAQQNAEAIQLDWRPPAGGNERLAGILARMRS